MESQPQNPEFRSDPEMSVSTKSHELAHIASDIRI